jgi:hypothetical protein
MADEVVGKAILLLEGYVRRNWDVKAAQSKLLRTGSKKKMGKADDVELILSLLAMESVQKNWDHIRIVLDTFQILFRKEANREVGSKFVFGLQGAIQFLRPSEQWKDVVGKVSLGMFAIFLLFKPDNSKQKQKTHCSSLFFFLHHFSCFFLLLLSFFLVLVTMIVILNFCYSKPNAVAVALSTVFNDIVSGLRYLDVHTLSAILGALQSITQVRMGKLKVVEVDAIPRLVELLSHELDAVKLSSLGVIHNISSEPSSIPRLRACGSIPIVVKLLQSEDIVMQESSVGTIQSLSCELASCEILREEKAVYPLCQIMLHGSVDAQASSVGSLYNVCVSFSNSLTTNTPENDVVQCFNAVTIDPLSTRSQRKDHFTSRGIEKSSQSLFNIGHP